MGGSSGLATVHPERATVTRVRSAGAFQRRGSGFGKHARPGSGSGRREGFIVYTPTAAWTTLLALVLCAAGALFGCGEDDPAEPLPGERHVRVPEDYPDLFTAIEAWNFGDTISLAPGVHTGEGFRDLVLDGRFVAIVGRSPESPSIIDLEEEGQALALKNASSLYLRDLVFRRGLSGIGGVLRVTESGARLERVRMEASSARYGGAVVVEDGALWTDGCEFLGNEATEVDGGAIFVARSEASLMNTIVTGNRANVAGGALSLDRSTVTATHSTFAGNAARTGGAFRVARSSNLDLVRSIVWQNAAEDGSEGAEIAGSASMLIRCSAIDTLGLAGAVASTLDLIAGDPRFCDPVPPLESPTMLGDYGIRTDSPCAPESSPCGLRVGASEPGCTSPR